MEAVAPQSMIVATDGGDPQAELDEQSPALSNGQSRLSPHGGKAPGGGGHEPKERLTAQRHPQLEGRGRLGPGQAGGDGSAVAP